MVFILFLLRETFLFGTAIHKQSVNEGFEGSCIDDDGGTSNIGFDIAGANASWGVWNMVNMFDKLRFIENAACETIFCNIFWKVNDVRH